MEYHSTNQVLARRLFVPQERWGWQYVEPVLEPRPELTHQPIWQEPGVPERLTKLQRSYAHSKTHCWDRLKLTGWVLLVGFVLVLFGFPAWLIALLALLGIGWSLGSIVWYAYKLKECSRETQTRREAAWAQHQHEQYAWQTRLLAHEQEEQLRRDAAPRWHPVNLQSTANRVDVVGGIPEGWEHLLVTVGSGLLEAGGRLLVLDFTEHNITNSLASVTRARGISVTHCALPSQATQFSLLQELSSQEIIEILAESVHSIRGAESKQALTADCRTLDAEILSAICQRLVEPITFIRLVAALKIVRRVDDGLAAESPLTPTEVRNLIEVVDTIGTGETVNSQLRFLATILDLVASVEHLPSAGTASSALSSWSEKGLAIVATSDSHARRKDVLERILFHRILHQLRTMPTATGLDRRSSDAIVLAGADHFSLESIEILARQARRVGIRLVLMVHRLRGDLTQLLGSSDSATMLMRLGNTAEATAAAEFIGRGHKFVLSQTSEQMGTTVTEGTGQSYSYQDGTSHSFGTSSGTGRSWSDQGSSSSTNRGTSTTKTASKSESWQNSTNSSTADSFNTGKTMARVYEFTVEPTSIQALPPTAFFFVEATPAGRRVVMGDCYPGIMLSDQVASVPYPC